MSTDPKVQITSEPGLNRQFGSHWRSYQKSPFHVSKPMAAGCGIAVCVTVVVLVCSGSPNKKDLVVSRFLGIEMPLSPTDDLLVIPPFHPGDRGKEVVRGKPRSAAGVARYSGPELLSRPRNISIPPGAMIEAILTSGASDGPVRAELKEPLLVSGETLLEIGTVLIGTGQSGKDRLMIQFRKAVFRDGTTAKVDAQAADSSDRIPGIKGSQVGYRALKLAASVGLNFAGGLSQGLQDTQGQAGAILVPPSMKNAILNGAGRATLEEGRELMNEYRSEKPVITVGAGTTIVIFFTENG